MSDEWVIEYPAATIDELTAEAEKLGMYPPLERGDQRTFKRQSPRPTLNQLAEQWQNGPDEAKARLKDMLENAHRFDARDRSALAYLLMKEWGVK